jgi:hypothetical protein
MAAPATRKAPALEESGWRKSPNTPTSAASSRSSRTRTRGTGRVAREGTGARSPASGGASVHPETCSDGVSMTVRSKNTDQKSASPPKPSRRNGRASTTPLVKVEAPTPTTEAFSTPAPSSSQRKRSQARSSARTPSPVQAKSVSPAASAPTALDMQPTVRGKQAGRFDKLDRSKDAPPHLVPATDSAAPPAAEQQNIASEQQSMEVQAQVDTLVEHMRTAAIHRPTSPTTHIDWAVDEDDTLPDLNDWGYNSKQGTLEPECAPIDIISPILENSLKSLPILGPLDSEGSDHGGSQAVVVDTVIHVLDQVDEEPILPVSATPEPSTVTPVSSRPSSPEKAKSRRGARAKGPKGPVNGEYIAISLPICDALNAFEDVLSDKTPQARNYAHAAPGNHASPSARLTSASASPAVSALKDISKDKEPRSGLKASIHAPKSGDDAISSRSPLKEAITARKDILSSPSTTLRPPRSVRDRHARLNSVHGVEAAPTGGATHTRTQSAPVTSGRRGPRAPGAARPVIAGSAISMLAKTLGSPQRNPSPNPSSSRS